MARAFAILSDCLVSNNKLIIIPWTYCQEVYSFCHIVCLFVPASFINFNVRVLHFTFAFIRQWHWSGIYVSPYSLAVVCVNRG